MDKQVAGPIRAASPANCLKLLDNASVPLVIRFASRASRLPGTMKYLLPAASSAARFSATIGFH
jgi:hypothetical protein